MNLTLNVPSVILVIFCGPIRLAINAGKVVVLAVVVVVAVEVVVVDVEVVVVVVSRVMVSLNWAAFPALSSIS